MTHHMSYIMCNHSVDPHFLHVFSLDGKTLFFNEKLNFVKVRVPTYFCLFFNEKTKFTHTYIYELGGGNLEGGQPNKITLIIITFLIIIIYFHMYFLLSIMKFNIDISFYLSKI